MKGMCNTHYHRDYQRRRGTEARSVYEMPDGTRALCAVLDCDNPVKSRNLCSTHYQRVLRNGEPLAQRRTKWTLPDGTRMKCIEEGCEEPVKVSARCALHYDRMKKGEYGKPFKGAYSRDPKLKRIPNPTKDCPVEGCGKKMAGGRTICSRCNQFRWRYGLEYDRLFELFKAENRVCSNLACRSTKRLHLDHDHSCCNSPGGGRKGDQVSCGKCVRGWLCGNCNTSMGLVGDDPVKLQGLIDFLEQSKKAPAIK